MLGLGTLFAVPRSNIELTKLAWSILSNLNLSQYGPRTLPMPLHGGAGDAAVVEGRRVIARVGYDTRTWKMEGKSGATCACICVGASGQARSKAGNRLPNTEQRRVGGVFWRFPKARVCSVPSAGTTFTYRLPSVRHCKMAGWARELRVLTRASTSKHSKHRKHRKHQREWLPSHLPLSRAASRSSHPAALPRIIDSMATFHQFLLLCECAHGRWTASAGMAARLGENGIVDDRKTFAVMPRQCPLRDGGVCTRHGGRLEYGVQGRRDTSAAPEARNPA